MDYAYLCKKIGDMSSIPIRLYINNELNMFYSFRNVNFAKNNALKSVELLAPAKDLQSAVAAVDYGADAVYIGGAKFGARYAAGNSAGEIARCVDLVRAVLAECSSCSGSVTADEGDDVGAE